MLDLTIDRLNLQIHNASGQEHRIRPIANRALAILANRIGEHWAIRERLSDSPGVDSLSVPPLSLSLNQMTDEQVAERIASALLEALARKLEV